MIMIIIFKICNKIRVIKFLKEISKKKMMSFKKKGMLQI